MMRVKRGYFRSGNSAPRALTRTGHGLHDQKVVSVPTFEWLKRDGPGMSKCTRCGISFTSSAHSIRNHARRPGHLKKGES
jgi:hypothetical protein